MDGSKVLSHTFKKNNANFQSGDLITRWEEDRVQEENIDGLMFPFGFGDGGGGPTRDMVEMARRCADLEGAPRCHMESPVRYFERHPDPENTFCGELYLAWHRGTLTSQAKTKAGIRRAEIALKRVEFVMSMLMVSGQAIRPEWKEKLEQLWKLLLFNQFHDIAPGTSIARVHERAEKELERVQNECTKLIVEMIGANTLDTATIYNPHPWTRSYRGLAIPPHGYVRMENRLPLENQAQARYLEEERCYELSNTHLVCRVNQRGELISVKRQGSDREYMSGVGNRFLMFKDVNTCYDAWELGSMYENLPVSLDDAVYVTMHQLPGAAALEVSRKLHDSELNQWIILNNDDHSIAFETEIDWQENHKMLKVAFPVNIYTKEAIHETQFGYVKRPTHRSYQSDKDRYEVCNHRYTALCDGAHGAAVLNDSKYAVNVVDNEIRLTLLKSAMMPDMYADRGAQSFTYAFYPFAGSLAQSDIVREATQLNEPLIFGSADMKLNVEQIFIPDQKNIIVDTIKPADTVENALLVRAYESMGMKTSTSFHYSERIGKIVETDMLEENPVEIQPENVEFGSFEIKTFLLYLK